jgi:hypothetical protein
MQKPKETTVPFETALHCIKNGSKATRSGWEGDCYIFMMDSKAIEDTLVPPGNIWGVKEGRDFKVRRYIMRKTREDFEFVPYTPTQDDILKDDWKVLR